MFDCNRCGPCKDLNCYQRKVVKDCGEYIRKGFDKALNDAAIRDVNSIEDDVFNNDPNAHLNIVRDVQKRIYEALEKTKMPESASKNVEDVFNMLTDEIKEQTKQHLSSICERGGFTYEHTGPVIGKIIEESKGKTVMIDTDKYKNQFMNDYIKADISMTKQLINSAFGAKNADKFGIKDVKFNDPATIVFWEDGTKTVVKAQNEAYDPEKGLAMAIAKKAMGNKHDYYIPFKRYLKRYYKGLEK